MSPLLASEGFAHAFFTRHGGVSRGAHATLNFTASTGDVEENVHRNLAIAAGFLGIPVEKLYLLSQVHGTRVVLITGEESREALLQVEGDALLSGSPGVACGVRVADCVPVLLADARSGFVGAVHAGWRGAVAGVVLQAVEALRSAAPSSPWLLAAVGPHLSADAFEIGEEVAVQMEEAAPGEAVVRRMPGKKPHGDLGQLVTWQLRRGGVECIDLVPGCTFQEPERFFSFRRDGVRSGRHLAAIVPRRR
ncbi:MAG: peptidoglycan editing factor PgeF [Myxococcales bacterium]|nr:peptidoglycan editing factor PgeF [Polyangiaceae bacterium]MDW8248900.1 peptidoglycan editing factor PgeF [Myxococcales bacterium]